MKNCTQNALFRSCAARFGQIALLSGKVLKIVKLASNSLQNGKTVRFPWKLYKTLFFMSCCARFSRIAFVSVKVLKNRHTGLKFLPKRGKQCALDEKLYKKASFSGHAQHVLAKSHFWASKFSKCAKLGWNSLENGKTVRFPWKLYKTLFSDHAQHVLAKSHFLSVKVLKIVTSAWNSRQKGKTVRFPWKFYQTLFTGHA